MDEHLSVKAEVKLLINRNPRLETVIPHVSSNSLEQKSNDETQYRAYVQRVKCYILHRRYAYTLVKEAKEIINVAHHNQVSTIEL